MRTSIAEVIALWNVEVEKQRDQLSVQLVQGKDLINVLAWRLSSDHLSMSAVLFSNIAIRSTVVRSLPNISTAIDWVKLAA